MSDTYGEWARLFAWLGTTGLTAEEVMQAVTDFQKKSCVGKEIPLDPRQEKFSFVDDGKAP